MTAPEHAALRQRLTAALHDVYPGVCHQYHAADCRACADRADAVMAVVRPALDAKDAEIARLARVAEINAGLYRDAECDVAELTRRAEAAEAQLRQQNGDQA